MAITDPAKLQAFLVKSITYHQRDPDAVKYREVAGIKQGDKIVVCDQMNTKNAFGAYIGFRRFVVTLADGTPLRLGFLLFKMTLLCMFWSKPGNEEPSELDAPDPRLPALGRLVGYRDAPLNEAPALAACRAVLVDAVAERLAGDQLSADTRESTRIACDPGRRELAIKIE